MTTPPTTPTVTDEDVFTALGQFIASLGLEPIQGQVNRTASPAENDYAVMTPLRLAQIATNQTEYIGPNGTTKNVTLAQEIRFQVDFHGPNSSQFATLFQMLFRDNYAIDIFSALGYPLVPCYSTDPIQAPFITGGQQYENRWTVEAVMQGNPQSVVPQQYADIVTPTIKPPVNALQ